MSSLLIVDYHGGGGVYGESVSWPVLPTLMWIFSFTQWKEVIHLVLGFFSEEIVPYVAFRFSVSMGGSKFRILLHCYLEPEPPY